MNNFKNIIFTPIAILFIAISAQLSINLPEAVSAVPITGQTFAVLIIAHLMKEKWASIVIILYLIIGLAGAPVFSDYSYGLAVITGPSGGYLIGFILGAFVTGKIASNQNPNSRNLLIQMTLGSAIILSVGYIGLFQFLSPKEAFIKGIKPYLIGAFVKIFLSVILLTVYYKLRALMNNKLA